VPLEVDDLLKRHRAVIREPGSSAHERHLVQQGQRAALLVLYWLTARFGPAWVPAFVATMAVLREVQLLFLQPHSGALLGPAAAIALLATAALLWSRSLQSRPAAAPR
jgi:hypothetical protein